MRLAATVGCSRCMLRVNSGVHASTHEYLATAREDQKFGIPLADVPEVVAAIRVARRSRLPRAALAHRLADLRVGRLRRGRPPPARGARGAARRRTGARAQPRRRLRHRLHERRRGDADRADRRATSPDVVASECAALGIPVPVVAIEPGRSIIGPSTVTLYEVGTVKDVDVDARTPAPPSAAT